MFWEILSHAELNDLRSASASMINFRSGARQLRIDQDSAWISYGKLLEWSIEPDLAKRKSARIEFDTALQSLFNKEKETFGYDGFVDGGIIHALRVDGVGLNRVVPTAIARYRREHGARAGSANLTGRRQCSLDGKR
jgi:hypothetical protein